jgi:hypothetical protein
MGKTRNTGKLATQIQFDNSNNLVIGTSASSSFNTSGSVNAIGGITGSIFGIGNPTSFSSSISSNLVSIQSVTASNIARLSNLETKSSSVDISVSSINTFTASNGNTSLNLLTSSLATTGSNTFKGTQIVSASMYVQGDFVVYGSSSIQYISASSVSIGTNIVQLNTANPAVRYAGLSVQDSGSSAGVTGSILWDSLCNRWIYSNPSTIGYSGGMLMSGPRTSTLGTESPLTCNYIAKSGGGDHLYDSCIIDDGTTVCVNANLKGTGTISGTHIYASTVSCSPVGCFTTLCTEYLYPYNISMGNTFIRANGNKLGIGTGNPLGVLSITGGQNSLSSLATYSSIEPLGIFNMFYINSGTYPFYLDIAAIGDTMSANGGSNIRFLTHCGTANATPVERMRIDNCGRVGINVTTPCSALHIVDSSANATTLTIGEAGEVPTIKAGGTNTDLRIEAVGGGGFLEFVTNGTNRFRTVGTGETTFTCQICTPGISITSNPIGIEYLIVAGGGGGGYDVGGGGGAGGVLNGSTGIWPGTYTIGVGGGGAGSGVNATTQAAASNGYNTYAIGLMSMGGGGGGNYSGGNGASGGSGGGGAGYGAVTNAGLGMAGQGYAGGCGYNIASNNSTGGAGGGAGGVGSQSISAIAGSTNGTAGILATIIGQTRSYGCGGRGGGDSWTGPMYDGVANTGYGGDGAGNPNGGCAGGSGIVILKMKNTNTATFSGGLTAVTCTNIGTYNIYVVTAGAGTVTIV